MSDDLPFGSRGGALIRYYFPLDGEYSIKALLRRQEYDYIIGMGEPHELDFRLDGVLLKRFSIGGEAQGHDDARKILPAIPRAIRRSKSTCTRRTRSSSCACR